jgi:hypothetical protein
VASKRQFESFQKWFLYYQKELGLVRYTVDFEFQDLDDGTLAECDADSVACIATVRLTKKNLPDLSRGWVRETAKHEAIHLLLAELKSINSDRHSTEDEWHRAEERFVCTIERLLD